MLDSLPFLQILNQNCSAIGLPFNFKFLDFILMEGLFFSFYQKHTAVQISKVFCKILAEIRLLDQFFLSKSHFLDRLEEAKRNPRQRQTLFVVLELKQSHANTGVRLCSCTNPSVCINSCTGTINPLSKQAEFRWIAWSPPLMPSSLLHSVPG